MTPVDGAFVINIGDMVQVWSNDTYRAALHRVLAMENAGRFSIPFFYNPSSAIVEPLECASEPHRYNGIDWSEFRRRRADGDYADVGKEVQIADYQVAGYAYPGSSIWQTCSGKAAISGTERRRPSILQTVELNRVGAGDLDLRRCQALELLCDILSDSGQMPSGAGSRTPHQCVFSHQIVAVQ